MYGSVAAELFAPPPRSGRCAPCSRSPVCVLAPVSKPATAQKPPSGSDSIQHRVSSAFTGTANHILSFVRTWRDDTKPEQAVPSLPAAEELLRDTAERAVEATEQEADSTKPAKPAPPNISSFLRPAGLMETRYVRLLSSLCAQTYYMNKMTPRSLYRRHRLQLVTSSLACERFTAEVPRSAAQILADSDAMAASPADTEATHALEAVIISSSSSSSVDSSGEHGSAVVALSKLEQIEPVKASKVAKKPKPPSPKELVAAKLASAAAAAAAAAAPLTSNLTSIGSSVGSFAQSAVPVHLVASQLQLAAAAGQSTAIATFATVSAALDSSMQRDRVPKPARGREPVEWYVADDAETHTRYFIIQGSDNFDHWKTNLTFDPVAFEDPELGVSVHRGVYETAAILYARFEPLVAEHMASSPFAKVAFAGHSLGGSLATLLMLMYLRRGVLPAVAISPVYTFGAPAVFCEGNCACSGAAGACSLPKDSHTPAGPSGILQKLGLPEGAVRNVMMPKDIVPRAFACDYTLVADLLKRVGTSFREHSCLAGGERVALYASIGKQLLLQPDPELRFIRGEGFHPMLPPEIGLFILQEPTIVTAAAEASRLHTAWPNKPSSTAVQKVVSPAAAPGGTNRNGRPATGPPVQSVQQAVAAIMDNPHPLETLADSGAYGPDGTISRYHNPDAYTLALASVVRAKPWWRSVGGTIGAGNGAGAGPRTYFTPAADRVGKPAAQPAERHMPEHVPGSSPAPVSAPRRSRGAGLALPHNGPVNNTLPYVAPLKRVYTPARQRQAAAAATKQDQCSGAAPGSPRR